MQCCQEQLFYTGDDMPCLLPLFTIIVKPSCCVSCTVLLLQGSTPYIFLQKRLYVLSLHALKISSRLQSWRSECCMVWLRHTWISWFVLLSADLPGRRTRSLRSSTSHQLDIPAYRLESIGRRSFPVAASILWNNLPCEIQSSPSLTLFRQRLKTYLF